MKTVQCGRVCFGRRLGVDLEIADEPTVPAGFLAENHLVGFARVGTTGRSPRQLWLSPGSIRFTGMLAAGGADDFSAWRACVIQSILQAAWTGHYTNGAKLRYRLNTTGGPLKDGKAGGLCLHFLERLRADDPQVHTAEIVDFDSPCVTFWRDSSGDPYRPHDPASLGQLHRTEGETRFQAYLAVVNESERQIITLAECHWTVTWDGEYDNVGRRWHSRRAEGMIAHRVIERTGQYRLPAETPFSVLRDEALRSAEIGTPAG